MNDSNSSKRIVTDAKQWLNKNSQQKFLLWIHLMDVHEPYYPDSEYRCKFNTTYCDSFKNKSSDDLDQERAQFQTCQQKAVPKNEVEKMKTLYDGDVAQADYYIGQLLDKIKSLGLDKNSVIVVYADHGEGFDHNYYFNHRQVLYDSAVKIPLIIRDPLGDHNGQKVGAQIENTDIMPTILELLGIYPQNYNIDGKSFGSKIGGSLFPLALYPERKYTYSVNNTWTKYSIFDGVYKYIYSLPKSCLMNGWREELYDLSTDPNEQVNLASKNQKKLIELKSKLLSYLSKYNLPPKSPDTTPTPIPDDNDKSKLNEKDLENIKSIGY